MSVKLINKKKIALTSVMSQQSLFDSASLEEAERAQDAAWAEPEPEHERVRIPMDARWLAAARPSARCWRASDARPDARGTDRR